LKTDGSTELTNWIFEFLLSLRGDQRHCRARIVSAT